MLRGARITGSLDLSDRAIVCPLWLQDCQIVEPVNLNEATAPSIRFSGCHVPSLAAGGLRTSRDLMLDEKFTAEDEVLLRGARIGRSLSLDQSRIAGLSADRLTVEGSMSFRDASVRGEIRLLGAHIGGQLVLNGTRLVNPGGTALAANRLNVTDDMFCMDGFTAQGEVNLAGAHVGGQICLDGATLANPGGLALRADRLAVDDNLFCESGFTAEGEVSLLGARIDGQLVLNSATLANTGGRALSAEGLTVGESMFCGNGFRADGEVRLLGARVGGHVSLAKAILSNGQGAALTGDRLTVEQDMTCEGFTAHGEIHLPGARVGELDLSGALLDCADGMALDLNGAQIGTLTLTPRQSPAGTVDLTNAKVGRFADDPASWPMTMSLRGFAYDTLENDQVGVRARLGWLNRHTGGYTPQLFDQLAAAYRQSGHENAARKVAIAKQMRSRSRFNPLNWLWYVTVGYGYRTWLAAGWLAALIVLGIWIFSRAYPAHMIATSTKAPAFHAPAYALDVVLPVLNLGEKSAWQATGTYQYWAWALTGAGWTLSGAVVAALTGILKRD